MEERWNGERQLRQGGAIRMLERRPKAEREGGAIMMLERRPKAERGGIGHDAGAETES